jgi:hypothetical protein
MANPEIKEELMGEIVGVVNKESPYNKTINNLKTICELRGENYKLTLGQGVITPVYEGPVTYLETIENSEEGEILYAVVHAKASNGELFCAFKSIGIDETEDDEEIEQGVQRADTVMIIMHDDKIIHFNNGFFAKNTAKSELTVMPFLGNDFVEGFEQTPEEVREMTMAWIKEAIFKKYAKDGMDITPMDLLM